MARHSREKKEEDGAVAVRQGGSIADVEEFASHP
jgi:hypothetical protein